MSNPIDEFTHAMQAVGLILDKHGVIDDGKIHQCRCAHDSANKKSGRYYLHSDGIANGAFGCYHESENALANEWKSTAPTPPQFNTSLLRVFLLLGCLCFTLCLLPCHALTVGFALSI